MAQSKEYYRAQPMAADSSYKIGGVHMSGFLCTEGLIAAATLTVTDNAAEGDVVVVDALPVAAGQWIRIPLMFSTPGGGTVTLAGGAAGTLFI